MAKFTVDTHLFRELGELLVGRDSTALIELIKNAYDADATEVTVHGEYLDDPRRGGILVADNGTGMDAEEFEKGFLRIASRMKDRGARRSPILERRYVGAKGIGRLAAHKLARNLEVISLRRYRDPKRRREVLYAKLDWDEIENFETLDSIDSDDAVYLEGRPAKESDSGGTTLILSQLRRAWTNVERARFFAEVQSFAPPAFLVDPFPQSVIEAPLLFETPFVRDTHNQADGANAEFSVRLEGELAAGEDYWELVAGIATWVVEIRAASESEKVHFAIAPTKKEMAENPDAKTIVHTIDHPTPMTGPHFDARILVREGSIRARRDERVWAAKVSGIRVYMEGFRVLPYGDEKDDWLSIDADYTRRPRQLELLQELAIRGDGLDRDEGLMRVPNNNYFGAVFLTQEHSANLRTLVNREGFVPEGGFDTLVRLVRTGVDLCTRARAAAAYRRREQRRSARRRKNRGKTETPAEKAGKELELPERVRYAVQLMKQARVHINSGDTAKAERAASLAVENMGDVESDADDVWNERSLLHVLASVGTQMASFVHEIRSLVGAAQVIESALGRLLDRGGLSHEQRRRLRHTVVVAEELRHGLERQAAYLVDIEMPDARRRRSRQRLAERFEAAARLVRHQAERQGVTIVNRIPPGLGSPPMFPAELTMVFSNLLTNALKASGQGGEIDASGAERSGGVSVRIQNTGATVRLKDAERWFKPFESTTLEPDPVLGQGMGLGLTITRNLLEMYGGYISFVEPANEFATAIEISLPVTVRNRTR